MHYYETLVCENGHYVARGHDVVTSFEGEYCPRCGAKVLSQCPSCGGAIISASTIPDYCTKCGGAYPWNKKDCEED